MAPVKQINAQIEGTHLRFEREVFLTAWLYLDYGDSGHQGFGGRVMCEPLYDPRTGKFIRRQGTAFAGEYIRRLLETVGAEKWEDLKGRYVRIRYEGETFNREILAIGHITKDKWFDPSVLAEEYATTREEPRPMTPNGKEG